jgi:hypothetical protein
MGSQYTARVLEQLLELFKVDHRFALVERPQAMGKVERSNGEAMRHLRALVFDSAKRGKWSEFLPLVQRIMNSTVHSATGVAPVTLMFAGQVEPNQGVLKSVPASGASQTYESYLSQLLDEQAKLVQRCNTYQQEVIDRYLKKSPENLTEFNEGDQVLVSYHDRAPTKLHPKWQGPFVIVAKRGNTYALQDVRTLGIKEYDVTRLKKYHPDPTVDSLEIAAVDKVEYVVEAIVNHRYTSAKARKKKLKSQLEFQVAWRGYPADQNTWEPYAQVKSLAALDAYAKEHPELRL